MAASTIRTMNTFVSFLTLDRLYLWSQFAVYIFGGIALITGKMVNDRQALQIETLRSENLKLQAKIAPRRLTSVQKESLSKFLSDAPGAIAIVSCIFDLESSDFADDFDSAFRSAHWETVRIKNRTVPEYGLSVGTLEGTELGDTNRVADALRSIGISHRVRTFGEYDKNRISPSLEPDVLYLVIDKKPVSAEQPVNLEIPK
jgi:hypothetical protein